ncbi:hypothetical protein CL654_00980 [bacterium]|nr:hypothetical protein [bacterium]|tara:strand:+ start:93 stop:866 length:774 start_codon:yes stop_codon:yes gene_type:complete
MEEPSLKEQLESLPIELQNFILSEETRGRTRYIGESMGLTPDQVSTLEEEVFISLIGSNSPQNLPSNFVEGGIDQKTANKLVDELHKTIFSQVRGHLNKIYKEENQQIEAKKQQAPPNLPTQSSTNEIPIKKEASIPAPAPTQVTEQVHAPPPVQTTPKPDTSSDLEQTLADLDTILKPDPATKPNWLHKEVGEKQKILHDLEVPPPPDKKEKSVFEKKLDENLYKKDSKKKPSDDPTSGDETHKKFNSDPYREPIP